MDENLKKMIGVAAPVAIDFQRSIFGEGFVVSYGGEACCESGERKNEINFTILDHTVTLVRVK